MKRKLIIGGILIVAIAVLVLWAQRALEIPERLAAVPEELTTRAEIPAIPNARYWVGIDTEPFTRDVLAARQREQEYLARSGQAGGHLDTAEQHMNGRILLIGTTNLDARQPVIWNMGNIAASGAPGALDLFRSILLASAAIPGAVPPTMVRVEVDGQPYDEMHVDGGASAQVFLYPPSMPSLARAIGEEMSRSGRAYIIRNSSLESTWDPADRRTIDIAGRAVSSLIQTQGFGDLYRIYVTAQRDGFDFDLAFIGPEFEYGPHGQFDTGFMNALYDYGYGLGRGGYPWQKFPPGWEGALLAPQ